MLATVRRGETMPYCESPDCFRQADRDSGGDGTHCAACRKRLQRQSVARVPRYETPLGRAFEASLALRDFPTDGERDDDFVRAYDRWRKAIEAVARTMSRGGATLRPR